MPIRGGDRNISQDQLGSCCTPHSAQSTWMAYLRGRSTSSFISKSGCIYFTLGRGFVLSKPSFFRGIQGKDAMVTETCRQSSNLSIQCDGWEDKFERRNTDTSQPFELPRVKLPQACSSDCGASLWSPRLASIS